MKKRKIGILALLLIAITCFSVGIVGCAKTDARIVIQTDVTELVFARGDSYTTPIAGVFDSNLDRINGVQVAVKAYNAKGDLIDEGEPSEQVYLSFYSLGKWKIEYVAYRDGKRASDIPTKSLTAYVCSRLTAPKNFTVSGNTLSWSAVNNASGYEITVNGGDPVEVSGTSFTSDIFSEVGFYVGVTAKGDNRNYVNSNMASYRNRTPLADGVLMAFDDPNYELDVRTAVDSKITLPPDEIEWLSEEEVAGSTGGALKLRVRSGNYGWGVFKILLTDMIKLDTNLDWTGMEIRFKVDSQSYREDTWFFLNSPTGYNNAQRSGMHITSEQNDQWHVLKLSKDVVLKEKYTKYLTETVSSEFSNNVVTWSRSNNEYGYQITVTKTGPDGEDDDATPDVSSKTYTMYSIDQGYVIGDNTTFTYDITTDSSFYQAGDEYSYSVDVLREVPTAWDQMDFNLYDLVRTTGKGYIYFDYIRLYKTELSAPENFGYEDGKIVWDAVDGAARYTLNVMKTVDGVEVYSQYYIDGSVTEFDIANAGLTANDKFRAEIMAIPADATYCSSEYSRFSVIGTPTNLSVSDGILSWTAVDNARRYIVNVNGLDIVSENTSFDLTSYLNKDVSAKVKAIAAPGYLDSGYSAPWVDIKVEGMSIATFNSVAYQETVKLGLENTVQPWIATDGKSTLTQEQYQNLSMAKTYMSGFSGTDSGVLYIQPVIARYKGSGSGRHALFTVVLPEALDGLDDGTYDGIKIKFRLDAPTVSGDGANKNITTPDRYYVNLVGASTLTAGYEGKTGVDPCTVANRGEWTTWIITAEELASLDYKDGATELAFAIVYENGCSNLGFRINTYLDDISYCKTLAAPADVNISGNVLSWDAVTNANGYVVKIGDTEITVTETQLDISQYLDGEASILVQAVDTNGVYEASEYGAYYVVAPTGKQIANFTNQGYADYIKLGAENTVQPTDYGSLNATSFAALDMAKEYVADVEGSTGGALHIQPVFTRYKTTGSARHALFTVLLPKALDGLDDGTYDGITIRFKITDVTNAAVTGQAAGKTSDTYYLHLVDSDNITTGHTERTENSAVTDPYIAAEKDTWVVWNITTAQLATYYADGATELSFVVYNPTANNNAGYRVNTYLDYIEYYKAK